MQGKQQEYEVNLALFEGPLDLLLYLVNKSEVSIIDISVSEIAMQYIEYLEIVRDLNIDIASEYLHMAATLVRLKARELLPLQDGEELDQEDGIYNREQLIQQLLEYKKFKEAAGTLRIFEAEQFGAFTRGRSEVFETSGDEQGIDLGNISVFDLLTAFKRILERVVDSEDEYKHVVNVDSVNIDDRIEHILSQLTEHEEVLFDDLFIGDTRKVMVVVTFMAILELVKMQEIGFRQEVNFGPIFVCRKKVGDIPAEPVSESEAGPDLNDSEKM
ncbi:MAG: segregation/condensation protein A [Fibrobacter sp.]|nr:segregation/condensation protein A [Fibrobacter sp.]